MSMHFLTRVEKLLDLPPAEKAQVMRELRSHYMEVRDELIAAGMDADAASTEAERRLGKPEDVAAGMAPVYNVATWKNALLTVLPFIIVFLAVGIHAFTGVLALTSAKVVLLLLRGGLVVGAVRELVAGRRPVWLATWLAAALMTSGFASVLIGGRAALAINGNTHSPNYAWLLIIGRVQTAAICLLIAWKAPEWRRLALLSMAAGIISTTARFLPRDQLAYIIIGMLVGLLHYLPLLLVAFVVFARHSYSNATQASLFLYALSTVDTCFYWVFQLRQLSLPPLILLLVALLLGCAALVCTRASARPIKVIALIVGIALVPVLSFLALVVATQVNHLPAYTILPMAVISVAPSVLTSVFVMLLPLLVERRRSRKTPQIAA